MSASPPTRRGSGRGLGGWATDPTTPTRPLPREDLPKQTLSLTALLSPPLGALVSTHLKTRGMVELSPSLREGREVTSGEGRGQANVSRQRKANTGLAAALPSLSLDPPGGRVKNDG